MKTPTEIQFKNLKKSISGFVAVSVLTTISVAVLNLLLLTQLVKLTIISFQLMDFSSNLDNNSNNDFATIADRGTSVNIMNVEIAKKLKLLIRPVPISKSSVIGIVNCGG